MAILRKFIPALLVGVALGVGACASGDRGGERRTIGQTTDDAALTAKVKAAIATDVGAGTAAAINVQTYRGEVALTGFVDSQDEASRAQAAARKVSGVQTLRNDLRVKSASQGR